MVETRLELSGMQAVHAVRAVFTALTAVDGITRADVQLGRAVIEHDGRATVARLREALAVVGVEIVGAVDERRKLPTL
jgi:copper chaperone CopZ